MVNSSHHRHNSLPTLRLNTRIADLEPDEDPDSDSNDDNDINDNEPLTPNTRMNESFTPPPHETPSFTFRRSSLDSESYASNGNQSPRSLMAGQLSRMEIDEGGTGFGVPGMVKRRKRTSTLSSAGSAMDTDEESGSGNELSEERLRHDRESDALARSTADDRNTAPHRHSWSISPQPSHSQPASTSASPQKEYTWSTPRPSPRKAPTKQKKSNSKPRTRFLSFDPLSTSPPALLSTKKRSKSPPPSYSSSSLTFSSSEITGTNPTDPTDDMTGINGIGFRATPSMAYQRSQKRMKQIAEWKRRVAVEERGRRIEERRRGARGSAGSAGGSSGESLGGIRKGRVKWFDEVGK